MYHAQCIMHHAVVVCTRWTDAGPALRCPCRSRWLPGDHARNKRPTDASVDGQLGLIARLPVRFLCPVRHSTSEGPCGASEPGVYA